MYFFRVCVLCCTNFVVCVMVCAFDLEFSFVVLCVLSMLDMLFILFAGWVLCPMH